MTSPLFLGGASHLKGSGVSCTCVVTLSAHTYNDDGWLHALSTSPNLIKWGVTSHVLPMCERWRVSPAPAASSSAHVCSCNHYVCHTLCVRSVSLVSNLMINDDELIRYDANVSE